MNFTHLTILIAIVLITVAYFMVSLQYRNIDINLNNLETRYLKSEHENEKKAEQLDPNLVIQRVLKVVELYDSISISERQVYSQHGEDGVIQKLIEIAGISKYNGYYVEFGTEDGTQCNTRYLRESFNWTGLLMDGSNENAAINLHKETIMYSNILQLFKKYNVRKEMDILSEDTDYNDFHIVDEILKEYKPKILVHEINQQLPELCVIVPKEDRLIFWDGSNYHGGSVCAFWCLAKQYGYTMVYCENGGVNCFWLRNDLLESYLNLDHMFVRSILTPKYLYKKPYFVYRSTGKEWTHVKC